MREFFDIKKAAEVIIIDMKQSDIGFNRAWDNYNNEWFNNSLSENDKIDTMDFVVNILNKLYGDLKEKAN